MIPLLIPEVATADRSCAFRPFHGEVVDGFAQLACYSKRQKVRSLSLPAFFGLRETPPSTHCRVVRRALRFRGIASQLMKLAVTVGDLVHLSRVIEGLIIAITHWNAASPVFTLSLLPLFADRVLKQIWPGIS